MSRSSGTSALRVLANARGSDRQALLEAVQQAAQLHQGEVGRLPPVQRGSDPYAAVLSHLLEHLD